MPKHGRAEDQEPQATRKSARKNNQTASAGLPENDTSSPLSPAHKSSQNTTNTKCRSCIALKTTNTRLIAERDTCRSDLDLKTKEVKALKRKEKKGGAEAMGAEAEVKSELERLRKRLESVEMENTELKAELEATKAELKKTSKELTIAQQRSRDHYCEIKALRLQVERVQTKYSEVKEAYEKIRCWVCFTGGRFTDEARWFFCQCVRAGCCQELVGFLIRCFAEVTGIEVDRVPSARTVTRAMMEGGVFGKLQLGKEIQDAPALGVSTDGTSHRGVTIEGRHITLPASSYADDEDSDADKQWVTRLINVEEAISHTAEDQRAGLVDSVNDIIDTYNESPMAARMESTGNERLTFNSFHLKLKFMHGDHASDGKKFHALTAETKKSIILETLGQDAADLLPADDVLNQSLAVEDSEIDDWLRTRGIKDVTSEQRGTATYAIIQQRLGAAVYDKPSDSRKADLDLFLTAGCGAHKDLNALKYGTTELQQSWTRNKIPGTPPVLLPNKANASTIARADKTSAAAKKAIDASCSGAIKPLELLASVLQNKDSKKGYGDKTEFLISAAMKERFGVDRVSKLVKTLASVSRVCYQGLTYAAAEVVLHPDLVIAVIQDMCDSKDKPGQNHMEKNVLAGLHCPATLSELVALATYGMLVSWPYLATIRGNPSEGAEFVDMLELVDLHRRIPIFCMRFALNPALIFDGSTLESELTVTFVPPSNRALLIAIRLAEKDLPQVRPAVAALFRGCSYGWSQFTADFQRNGVICRIPRPLLRLFKVPSQNDPNESILGGRRIDARLRPNGTTESFSSRARIKLNNTEAFIKKCATADDYTYVRKRVRDEEVKRRGKRFGPRLAAHIRGKARKRRIADALKAEKVRLERVRLTAVGLQLDRAKINKMTLAQLRDQLRIYKNIVCDPELKKTAVWQVKTKILPIVLAAYERYSPSIPMAPSNEEEDQELEGSISNDDSGSDESDEDSGGEYEAPDDVFESDVDSD
ncbi:hypothetical protein FB45DRAFT_1138081 [Roridomyces roridus]|uniref:Uncharacterized protein n=1 Tax=Roridomyces roridus TaxID=1738132 RepID=A0AAD7C153_9AGAR|nr:hypothetical protein FB45DRAFT_1138081 [Roridomyces roridus]